MKLAMQMTVDGLVRALRMKAHEVGDDHEVVRRRAELSNEQALTRLAAESRGRAGEAGDEFGR